MGFNLIKILSTGDCSRYDHFTEISERQTLRFVSGAKSKSHVCYVYVYVFSSLILNSSCAPAGHSDTEWLTPAVSEKFQSRFGWRKSTADSGDTGLGTSDNTEGKNTTSVWIWSRPFLLQKHMNDSFIDTIIFFIIVPNLYRERYLEECQ